MQSAVKVKREKQGKFWQNPGALKRTCDHKHRKKAEGLPPQNGEQTRMALPIQLQTTGRDVHTRLVGSLL
jgi:hypothetical protein